MSMKRVMTAVVGFALAAMVVVSPASAAVVTFSGTLVPGDPTMPVVFISDPDCTGQGVAEVMYHEHPITAIGDGPATFTLTSEGDVASLYLMQVGWDPAAAFPYCLAGANDDPAVFTFDVVAGTSYVAVVFDDSFDQEGALYALTIDGPVVAAGGLAPPVTRPEIVPTTAAPSTTAPTTTHPATTSTTAVAPPTTTPTTVTSPSTTLAPSTTVGSTGVGQAPAARPLAGAAAYTG